MKKLIYLIVCTLMLSITANAQYPGYDTNVDKTRKEIRHLTKENIKLDIKMYVDNALKTDEKYEIRVNCVTQKFESTMKNSGNHVLLYLHYDNEYILEFTYKGCNTQKIYVNTRAPYDNWFLITQIKLNSKSNKVMMAGKIFYSDSLQDFKAIAYR